MSSKVVGFYFILFKYICFIYVLPKYICIYFRNSPCNFHSLLLVLYSKINSDRSQEIILDNGHQASCMQNKCHTCCIITPNQLYLFFIYLRRTWTFYMRQHHANLLRNYLKNTIPLKTVCHNN